MEIPENQPGFLSQAEVKGLMDACCGTNLDESDPSSVLQTPLSKFIKICRWVDRRYEIARKEAEETGLEIVGPEKVLELSNQIVKIFSCIRSLNCFNFKKDYWNYISLLERSSFEAFSNGCRGTNEDLRINFVRLWLTIYDLKKYIPMDRKRVLRQACQKIFKNGEDFGLYNFTQHDFWRCVAGVYPLPLTKEEAEESLRLGIAVRIIPNPMSFDNEKMDEVRREVGLPTKN